MRSRGRILYSLLLLLIVFSSSVLLCSVVMVCDYCSHADQTHICCHCSAHHTDCDTHKEALEHNCSNKVGGVLLEYIVPASNKVSYSASIVQLLCVEVEKSCDQHIGGDDPNYLYWVRNDILYDDPIHTNALLRAPPALV